MSAELITMLSALITLCIGMFAGFAWTARRADTNLIALETRLNAQFEKVDSRFEKVDARFEKLDAQLQGLSRDLTDVKVSVARIEGTPRHLQPVR